MAKLYGLANYIISELAMKLMTNKDFYKFVYYKDKDKNNESILNMPDLDNPIETLTGHGINQKCQVFLNKRPDKVLFEEDVCVFIYFDDQKNYNFSTKKAKTVSIKVGVLIHDRCTSTPHGARDICILSAIENALDGQKFIKGIGTCKVDRITPLYGLPFEYTGHEVLCEIDGFKGNCGQEFDIEINQCLR